MSPTLVQREAALAGAALLAVLLVVVIDRPDRDAFVAPPPASVITWERAVVWVTDATGTSACGTGSGTHVSGVVHPVLPCGVDLVVSAHGRLIRTEVVARGPAVAGMDFALTATLADELGVRDGDRIRWRFAG